MTFLVGFIGFSLLLTLFWSWFALFNMWQQVPKTNSLDRNILKVGFGMITFLTVFMFYLLF